MIGVVASDASMASTLNNGEDANCANFCESLRVAG